MMRASVPGRALHCYDPVERWSVVVLAAMLIYLIVGIPGENRADASQTDRVSPLNSWIWVTLLVMALPLLQRRWRELIQLLKGSWALLGLFGYFALSVTWALDPVTSQRRLSFTIVQFVLIALLVSGIRRAPILHVTIVAVICIGAWVNLATWVVAPGFAMASDGFAGLEGQKNQAGILFMYGILATVPCMFLVTGRLWKGVLGGSTLLMVALLAATRSTTSESVVISAMFVMPVILAIAQLPRRFIAVLAAMALFVLTSAILTYLTWAAFTSTDAMLPLRGATFSDRTDIWSFVIDEIHKRPWFGAGYESFWAINPAVQPSLKTDQWFAVWTVINEGHEGYLDLLATGGIFGLAGGLFVLLRTIIIAGRAISRAASAKQAWRDGSLARVTAVFHLALPLGLVLHNFTESNLFENANLLAVGFLICVLDLEKWRLGQRAEKRGTWLIHRELGSRARMRSDIADRPTGPSL